MNNKIWYMNGNYIVTMNTIDGTKERICNDDILLPNFIEDCKICISKYCDIECPMCYEGCNKNGKHGELLNIPFIDTLHSYTQITIDVNDMSHPQLILFLEKLKSKNIFTNIVINQIHFMKKYHFIRELYDRKLIYGIGVSLIEPSEQFISYIKELPTATVYLINGIVTKEHIQKLMNKNLSIVILGYKTIRRGYDYFDSNMEEILSNVEMLYDNINEFIDGFNIVSFDDLAVEQLDINRYFINNDELHNFNINSKVSIYIDLVNKEFSKNSYEPENTRLELIDDIDKMFEIIQSLEE